MEFISPSRYDTTWEIWPTGINCLYGSVRDQSVFFDMGTGFIVGGLVALAFALACGVAVLVLTQRIWRNSRRAAF